MGKYKKKPGILHSIPGSNPNKPINQKLFLLSFSGMNSTQTNNFNPSYLRELPSNPSTHILSQQYISYPPLPAEISLHH
jgi:hypothetical protein